MKQKLGLCCSLIHDPDLLILDEPTTGSGPAVAPPVLGTHRSNASPSPGHERGRRHGVHGRSRPFRLARHDGRRTHLGHRHALGAQGPGRSDDPRRGLCQAPAGAEAPRTPNFRDPPSLGFGNRARDRGGEPDPTLRQLHCRRLRELPDRTRGDLRLPRPQRMREDHHDEDVDRPASSHGRIGLLPDFAVLLGFILAFTAASLVLLRKQEA